MNADPRVWQVAGGRSVELDSPRIMGILNITPDSFSDGGRYLEPEHAVQRARTLIEDGAEILDIGGESTRPGSERIDADEQIRRVIPVIRAIRTAGIDAAISIDTTLAEVAEAAIEAGAEIINDVAAGTESEAIFDLAARTGAGLVLMHRLLDQSAGPGVSAYPKQPEYPGGVVQAVKGFLGARVDAALRAGVRPEAIVVDPGLGFGKSVEQNCQLIAGTAELLALGYPILSAASRKSFIGAISGEERPENRVPGSIAVSLAHFARGVRLMRVHDVREHAQALRIAAALDRAGE